MVTLGGSAMSKSKGNVVDPNDVIARYGTDTCRMFILFAAPPTQQLEWSDKQIEGIWRFLNRVWRLAYSFIPGDEAIAPKRTQNEDTKTISKEELERRTHVTIKNVTSDIQEDFGFNTAISTIMELVNSIYLYPDLGDEVSRHATETVLQLLNPFAPHITEELWHKLGHTSDLCQAPWPLANEKKMTASQIEIIIQVNGKLKDKILVAPGLQEEQVKAAALKSLEGKGLQINSQRVIYVPNKILNFVVSGTAKEVKI
jgi:leucyl-tRNA synthetase